MRWGKRGIWICGRGMDGRGGRGDGALEELDLIEGGLCVGRGGFDDFEGDMTVHSDRKRKLGEMGMGDGAGAG